MLDLLLFTHTDMDGYGCKLVMDVTMNLVGNNNYGVVLCNNPTEVDNELREWLEDKENVGSHTWIVFSDICPSEATLESLMEYHQYTVAGIRIYDHHLTNSFAKDYLGNDAVIIPTDDEKTGNSCGTSLLYEACSAYIYDHKISTDEINEYMWSELVELIRLWDTYEWKVCNSVDAKKLQLMFSMIGGSNFVDKYYGRITGDNEVEEIFSEVELEFINAKYECNQQIVNKLSLDDFIPVNIRGHLVALMIKGVAINVSEISDRFLELYPEFDAVAKLSTFGNWSFEFRAKKSTIDSANMFAVPIGGGGHPKASGAPFPEFIKNALTDALVRYLNGDEFQIDVSNIYTKEKNND